MTFETSTGTDLAFTAAEGMGSRVKKSAVAVVPFPFALSIIFLLLAFLCGHTPTSVTGAAQMHGARLGDGLADAIKVCLLPLSDLCISQDILK
jgi:hypothetical protein